MTKKKNSVISKCVSWWICHPWLKLIALILAVILWFYAKGQMNSF